MKLKLYSLIGLTALFTVGCEKSSSDEFENANGQVEVRLMESITASSNEMMSEKETVNFFYDANNRLTKVASGDQFTSFYYDKGNLANVKGDGDIFNVEELFNSPYDAFDTGEVIEYDNNANPKIVKFMEIVYDEETWVEFLVPYTAVLSYDDKPNPYFHSLKAAGLIDVLDKIKLNFDMNANSAKLVQARMLLPVNNLSKIEYKDENGETVAIVRIDYTYDPTNYPTAADVTVIVGGDKEYSTVNYLYK